MRSWLDWTPAERARYRRERAMHEIQQVLDEWVAQMRMALSRQMGALR